MGFRSLKKPWRCPRITNNSHNTRVKIDRSTLTSAQYRRLRDITLQVNRSRRGNEDRREKRQKVPKAHGGNVVTHTSLAVLSFNEAPEETAKWLMALREKATTRERTILKVDLAPLQSLGPAAALVLTAEMRRATALSPSLLFQARMPASVGPRDLLGEIGFYKYFPGMRPSWKRPEGRRRFYLEHLFGHRIDREAVVKIVQHLQNHRPRSPEGSALYEALTEGIKNSIEWGYGKDYKGYNLWWALAYRDEESGEMAYCLYDQGKTIPATIREIGMSFRNIRRLATAKSSSLVTRAIGQAMAGHGLARTKALD
jgi:hypothetical protein